MKIGRYVICQSQPDKEIKNLRYTKDDNNNVELNWDWPADGELKLALVLSDIEDESLEKVLQAIDGSDIKIVTKQLDRNYKELITAVKKKFTVYPAAFGENDEILVYDQRTNNSTPYIDRHVNISYEIAETTKLFSNIRTAEIIIHKPDACEVRLEDALYYTVSSSGRRYPADIGMLYNRALIRLQKDDEILLKVHDDFKDTVHISVCKE